MNEAVTLEVFYADQVRRDSREVALGDVWRSSDDPSAVRAVFWVETTEELCAERSPIPGVALTGYALNPFDPFPTRAMVNRLGPSDISVEVIARLKRSELDSALRDWEEHVNDTDGYEWLLGRLATTSK